MESKIKIGFYFIDIKNANTFIASLTFFSDKKGKGPTPNILSDAATNHRLSRLLSKLVYLDGLCSYRPL